MSSYYVLEDVPIWGVLGIPGRKSRRSLETPRKRFQKDTLAFLASVRKFLSPGKHRDMTSRAFPEMCPPAPPLVRLGPLRKWLFRSPTRAGHEIPSTREGISDSCHSCLCFLVLNALGANKEHQQRGFP